MQTPRRVSVPIYEDIVQMELQHKIDQLLLYLSVRLLSTICAAVLAEQAERVHRLSVHAYDRSPGARWWDNGTDSEGMDVGSASRRGSRGQSRFDLLACFLALRARISRRV